jgi:GNAT superfamily N-acetyltransferase
MTPGATPDGLVIEPATRRDVPLILRFIKELAEYEQLADKVVAAESELERTLFGERPFAEVILARVAGEPLGFALFFHNYSTFLGRPGLYLEDLYVVPEARGRGLGLALLSHLARLAHDRGCGRLEWWVLERNEAAIRFYRRVGAEPMADWTIFRLEGRALRDLALA